MATSSYIFKDEFKHILAALTPPNRLALEVSLATGLRISDVLNLRSDQIKERFTVRELKTGKTRRIYIPAELLARMLGQAGRVFVFESRLDWKKPRSRQAVYKDIKRAAALFRIDKKLIISPHSARKIYAVEQFHKCGDLGKVKELLNHSNEAVTILYAMADELTQRRLPKNGGKRR